MESAEEIRHSCLLACRILSGAASQCSARAQTGLTATVPPQVQLPMVKRWPARWRRAWIPESRFGGATRLLFSRDWTTLSSPAPRETICGTCEFSFHGPNKTGSCKETHIARPRGSRVLFLGKAALDRFQPVIHFLKEVFQFFQALRDSLLVRITAFLAVTFFAAGRFGIFFFLEPRDLLLLGGRRFDTKIIAFQQRFQRRDRRCVAAAAKRV